MKNFKFIYILENLNKKVIINKKIQLFLKSKYKQRTY